MAGGLTISTLNDSSGVLATQNGMSGIAKAWVNFNGVTTTTIRGSFNVSSVTRNGTGDYTLNFTTAMPDANYATNVNIGFTSPADYMLTPMTCQNSAYGEVAPTTTSFRYVIWNYNTSAQRDAKYNFISVFR